MELYDKRFLMEKYDKHFLSMVVNSGRLNFINKLDITRPNCALDKRKLLCHMLLDSKDKYISKFQNVSGFHLQDLHGFRVQILVT